MGAIISEILFIIGGSACFLIYGGYYTPKFKTAAEKEKHQALIKEKGTLFKTLGVLLIIVGIAGLVNTWL